MLSFLTIRLGSLWICFQIIWSMLWWRKVKQSIDDKSWILINNIAVRDWDFSPAVRFSRLLHQTAIERTIIHLFRWSTVNGTRIINGSCWSLCGSLGGFPLILYLKTVYEHLTRARRGSSDCLRAWLSANKRISLLCGRSRHMVAFPVHPYILSDPCASYTDTYAAFRQINTSSCYLFGRWRRLVTKVPSRNI